MGLRSVTPESPRTFSPGPLTGKNLFGFGLFDRLRHRFSKDGHHQDTGFAQAAAWLQRAQSPSIRATSVRRVDIGLPRQATFKRQNSERREKLCPTDPLPVERRAMSTSRTAALGAISHRSQVSSPPALPSTRASAPAMVSSCPAASTNHSTGGANVAEIIPEIHADTEFDLCRTRADRPASIASSDVLGDGNESNNDDIVRLDADLDTRWILNLSMQFRDKSEREKFFITFAETPTKWRRVTISCDYRDAEPGSLELDIRELRFQRDKNLQIYESICDYLPEIQFYDTVTNLKLKTTEGRLHVHVTEDVNEIVHYPSRSILAHVLDCDNFRPLKVRGSDLEFDSHLSGYVFKVKYKGKFYIKKEIPGPDNVDEFLYEINALHALHGCSHVIQLEGIVMDDSFQYITGLLIEVADQGAVVDLLYDHHGKIPWKDRLRWARHAVQGLSEVHEEGYVQGDFTLSNVVVDKHGNAKVIDINRRGCPVGWEPPELAQKIASNQKILMYIGEKTDLYQLGMTLWALAMDDDEPERHDPPLKVGDLPEEVPKWYCKIVSICLSARPRDRLAAKELLRLFPCEVLEEGESTFQPERSSLARGSMQYIEPGQAVDREDIEKFRSDPLTYKARTSSAGSSQDGHPVKYLRPSKRYFDSSDSMAELPRGRSPTIRHRCTSSEQIPGQLGRSYSDGDQAQIICVSPGAEVEYEELEIDGKMFRFPKHVYSFSDQVLNDLRKTNSCSNIEVDGSQPEPSLPDSGVEMDQDVQPHRPKMPSRTSLNSDSTPRNSHTTLPTPAEDSIIPRTNSFIKQPTEVNSILHPSPHNPTVTEHDQRRIRSPISHGVPSLPYADSGYDEPLSSPQFCESFDAKHETEKQNHT